MYLDLEGSKSKRKLLSPFNSLTSYLETDEDLCIWKCNLKILHPFMLIYINFWVSQAQILILQKMCTSNFCLCALLLLSSVGRGAMGGITSAYVCRISFFLSRNKLQLFNNRHLESKPSTLRSQWPDHFNASCLYVRFSGSWRACTWEAFHSFHAVTRMECSKYALDPTVASKTVAEILY